MRKKIALLPCLILVACLVSSCGLGRSKSDVARYLGLTEDEIVEILGTPTGWCGGQNGTATDSGESAVSPVTPRRILYRAETVALPKPLTGLDFVLSDAGLCREVAGYTLGFDSPEELLAEVGISPKELDRLGEDDKAIRFKTPELSVVEVYTPGRIADRYADFLVAG